MEPPEDPDLNPDVLEDQIAVAMERARTLAGLTVEAMVRRLRPTLRMPPASAGRGVRQNWYDWRQNPRSFPAVALVAAAKIAGQPVDALLSDSAAQASADTTRLESLERQVADLTRRLEERERQDRHSPAVRGDRFDVEALESALAAIEGRLYQVGRQLGRPWDESSDDDDSSGLGDALRRRIGTLEARLAVLAGMVGAPSGGYPSAPAATSLDDNAFQVWLVDVVAILQDQLPGVLERAERLIDVPRRQSQAGDGG